MAKDEKLVQPEKAALSLEDFEADVVSVSAGWLNKVWKKWPGDETIQELLAALDDVNKR